MNNFELHEMAQELEDTRTANSLARELVELQNSIPKIKADAVLWAISQVSMLSITESALSECANKLERGE